MGDDWKKEYCKTLAKDYKMIGDYKFGSGYCKMCSDDYDDEGLCSGAYPRCASSKGPIDSSQCMMIPRPNSDGDMSVIPKNCEDRSVANCQIDGNQCRITTQRNKQKCVKNTEIQFSDPTQQQATIRYPDYNPTCVSRNGEILPYYDENGRVTRECTFVTDIQDDSIRLIPEKGYKRSTMKDCVPLGPSNPTGAIHYTNPDFKHQSYKWNPEITDGKPFCNQVTKAPLKLEGGNEVKTPFLPIQYYEDNDDGKFYIREPFQDTKTIHANKHQGIYWNPQQNETFIA